MTATADAHAESTPRTDARVLIVADHPNTAKIERHYGPLAAATRDTRMVCLDAPDDVEGIRFREVSYVGPRLVGIWLLFPVALWEAIRGEYDLLVSISLIPYGSYALLVGWLTRTPAHLGIIGADLDWHAEAWYGSAVRWAIRRFRSVSVPGRVHRRRLLALGVAPDRAHILHNAIDPDHYRPPPTRHPTYDLLWLGRFAPEKDPTLFVEAVARLHETGHEVTAAMVGDGPLADDVRRAIDSHGLDEQVTCPGWVGDPRPYYVDSRLFVLTSERDASPLSVIEAMATGCPVVTPAVGSVTDAVVDGETGRVLTDRTPEAVAEAAVELLADSTERARLGANATRVREQYSYAAARDDWRAILTTAV